MANTFIKIATVTVGSGGSSTIVFSSIPSTYTDLQLVGSLWGTTSAVDADITLTLNSSTSGFSWKVFQGNGSSASSASSTGNRGGIMPAATGTTDTFGSAQWYFPDYSGSTNKSISVDLVNERNATTTVSELGAILWSNTSAINAITLTASPGNFAQYSTATLYGIKKS
jgi:hypothetical protein